MCKKLFSILILLSLIITCNYIYSQEIQEIKPNKILKDKVTILLIIGKNTNFDKYTKIEFPNGIKLISINVVSPCALYVGVKVTDFVRPGWYTMKIITSDELIEYDFRIYRPDSLIMGHDDYNPFFIRLKVGYEFTDVNNLSGTSFPRYGVFVNYSSIISRKHGLNFHIFSEVLGTSADTNTTTTTITTTTTDTTSTDTTTTDTSTQSEKKYAFEYNANIVFGFVDTDMFISNRNIRAQIGLIIKSGAYIVKKSDKYPYFLYYYGGFRLSVNPELYTDFLFGKSDNLNGYRLLLKLHTPIYHLSGNSRLYLGAELNQAVDNKEEDTYRIYASFDIDPIGTVVSIFSD